MERILDATERLLKKRPFREIAVAEIAQEAKAAPTSLYARFESKQAILGALFERHALAQRKLIEELTDPARWEDVPLAIVLRRALPFIVAVYQEKQGLIRAFLEQATDDSRFREDWAAVGDFIAERVKTLVLRRAQEVAHPNPSRGIEHCMEAIFGILAVRILMHGIDHVDGENLTEELVVMLLRYMGINDSRDH